jgi:hypothetical protein
MLVAFDRVIAPEQIQGRRNDLVDNIHEVVPERPSRTSAQAGIRRIRKAAEAGDAAAALARVETGEQSVHVAMIGLGRQHLGNSQDVPRTVERGGTVYPMRQRASSPKPADPVFSASPSAVASLGVVGPGHVGSVVVAAALWPHAGIRLGASRRMRAAAASSRRDVLVLPLRRGRRHRSKGFARCVDVLSHAGLLDVVRSQGMGIWRVPDGVA